MRYCLTYGGQRRRAKGRKDVMEWLFIIYSEDWGKLIWQSVWKFDGMFFLMVYWLV